MYIIEAGTWEWIDAIHQGVSYGDMLYRQFPCLLAVWVGDIYNYSYYVAMCLNV